MSQSNMYSDKETSMLEIKKRVQKFIEGKAIKKVIVVQQKLVNVVV